MPTLEVTRCVFLVRRGGSGAVAAPLNERAWEVHETHDPLTAMVELALLERAQALRAGWGLPRAGSLALAVDQPHHWPHWPLLLAALRMHLPEVAIWDVTGGGMTPVETARRSDSGKILQGVGGPTSRPTDAAGAMDLNVSEAVAPALTREELDMLLESLPDTATGDR